LASIDKATDFNKILEQTSTGLWSYSSDKEKFFENFETLYTNNTVRKKMSKNGIIYFSENLTPEIAYKTIMSYVN
jgi:hypothetical protein